MSVCCKRTEATISCHALSCAGSYLTEDGGSPVVADVDSAKCSGFHKHLFHGTVLGRKGKTQHVKHVGCRKEGSWRCPVCQASPMAVVVVVVVVVLEYMIFCKALWKFLRDDMKKEPKVGWNISPTYGPVYLLQEKHSHQLKNKKDMGNDGHYFVTATNITVAYTRCWEWQKGFKGDPRANERRATTMLQSLPQAVAAAMDARRGPDEEGALPGGELISDDVQASITNNSFEEIMEAVKNEQNYGDISSEDVMRCIPRGLILHPTKTGWLSCRHCKKGDKFLEFPNDIGVLHHFARGGAHNPAESPPPPGSSGMVTGDAPALQLLLRMRLPPAPSPSVARARFALGMPPLPPGHAPPPEPRASTSHTAEPRATTTTATTTPSPPKSKAPPAQIPPRIRSTLSPPRPRPLTRLRIDASSMPSSRQRRRSSLGQLCQRTPTRTPAMAHHPGNSRWKLTTWQGSSIRARSLFMRWLIQSRGHHLRTRKMHYRSGTRSSKFANPTRCSLGYMP